MGRTAEERERDRLDRERRRAARTDEASAMPPAPHNPPAAEIPAEPAAIPAEPEADWHAPVGHNSDARSAFGSEPAQDPFGADPEQAEVHAESEHWEADWVDPHAEDAATAVHPTTQAQAGPAAGEEPASERPLGLRRAGGPSVRDLPQVAPPSGRDPRRVGPVGNRRPRRRRRRLLLLFPLALIIAAAWFANAVMQPFVKGDGGTPVAVTIPAGAGDSDVARVLAQRGVINSKFFFSLRFRVSGKRDKIKAGTFTLRRDMPYGAAIDALTGNPAAAPTLKVTIPEGRSIREAVPLVRSAGLKGSYLQATSRSPRSITTLRRYGAPRGTSTLEGFLFPATFELRRGATATGLVSQQLTALRRAFGSADLRLGRRRNLSGYEVLTIASMIEREAGIAKDRRLISAVIANRLRLDMPLGIDATIRYRLNNWSRPLRQSELATNSAFNTRLRAGLPPTPIGNPGAESIRAALHPAKVKYLYYVVKPCGNGAHAFSSSAAQFDRDVAAYNRKRDQLGGKDPSRC
jgi:UPF0755 protein